MTEDSDALTYGAEDLVRRCVFNVCFAGQFTNIYRVDFSSNDGRIAVDVLRARSLRDANDYAITRGTFLLMVVLCGSVALLYVRTFHSITFL